MNEKLQITCNLILKNRNAMLSRMAWEMSVNDYAIMAAMITAANGVVADEAAYKKCKKLLRQNISGFSEIRGIIGAAVVTKMTMVNYPETYVQGVQEVYKKLRAIHKLTASASMVMAAMNIYEHAGVQGADDDIEKLEELYNCLKKEHPMLIDDTDRPYLSLLIASGLNVQQAAESIEATYEACKKLAFNKDAVHSMAQILALSSVDAETKCSFVKEVIRGMKEHDKNINKTWALPAIGALALLNMPAEQVVTDIIDADNYLTGKKGFKWYSVSPKFRRIYAILAVFLAYADEKENIGATIGTNITMTLTEALIMMIIICTTTTTVATTTSSSAGH